MMTTQTKRLWIFAQKQNILLLLLMSLSACGGEFNSEHPRLDISSINVGSERLEDVEIDVSGKKHIVGSLIPNAESTESFAKGPAGKVAVLTWKHPNGKLGEAKVEIPAEAQSAPCWLVFSINPPNATVVVKKFLDSK